jgi:hypothetical protein
MQDIGGNEDTEPSKEDLSFRWRELSVESLGHCQSIGKGMFFLARVHEKHKTQVYSTSYTLHTGLPIRPFP